MVQFTNNRKLFYPKYLFAFILFLFSPIFTYAAVPTDGLVGYWSFDEGTGTVAGDYSGNGNDGTLQGSMTESDWISGKHGTALYVDGVDDYVDIGDVGLTQTQGTINVWLNFPFYAGYGNAYTTNDNGLNDAIRMELSSWCAGWYPYMYDETMSCQSFDSVTLGEWVMLTTVWDATNMQGYTNGSLSFDAARDTTVTVNNLVLGRGYNTSAERTYEGGIDEVRVYNKELSQQEITRLYNMGK